MPISPIIKQIIEKHIDSTVYVIWQSQERINFDSGILKEVSPTAIQMNALNPNSQQYESKSIAIDDRKTSKILHIYNKLNIDLMAAKEVKPLAAKLRDSKIKGHIITNLKPFLKKDLSIVYRTKDNVIIVRGKFADMGIMGLSLLVAPFYNNKLDVPYNQVLNVYAEDIDLIDIKSPQ